MPDPLPKTDGFPLDEYLAARRDTINTALSGILDDFVPEGRLRSAMRYSLEAGGKRLRPILCLAATEAVGGDPEASLPAGCALELIHTYSLIHDDLPAVDNDALRRGKPSCHVAFDETTAVFAGDALHTLAFEVLSSEKWIAISPEIRLQCIRIIAGATGNSGMIEGQMRDMLAAKTPLTRDELRRLQELKTGALITAAVHVGALIGRADIDRIARMIEYGKHIGTAFQIIDDLLDIEGDSALMGKETGADRRQEKTTFPGLLGVEEARILARSLMENSLKALSFFGKNADPLREIACFMVERRY